MKIKDIVDLISSRGYKGKIYPNAFPSTSEVSCTVVNAGTASRRRGEVYDIPITVVSRAKHPKHSEESNEDVRQLLDMLTSVKIGDEEIVSIMANSPMPVYSGADENGNHYHTSVFSALISD